MLYIEIYGHAGQLVLCYVYLKEGCSTQRWIIRRDSGAFTGRQLLMVRTTGMLRIGACCSSAERCECFLIGDVKVSVMGNHAIQQPRRVLLAIKPRLLREMLRHAILKSPYLRLVGEVCNGRELSSMVEEKDPQWVIMSLSPDGELPDTAERLWMAEPSISILAVASDGSQVKMGWKQPYQTSADGGTNGNRMRFGWTESHEVFLEDLSLEGLIFVLRQGPLWEPIPKDQQRDLPQH